MPRIKEVNKISEKIIQKLEAAIIQTVNARLFYEKYQSLLDEAKKLHEKEYVPL
jgi:hypothetical protein